MADMLPAPERLALAIIPLGVVVAIGNAVLLALFQVERRLPDIVQASATAFVIAEGSLVAIWISTKAGSACHYVSSISRDFLDGLSLEPIQTHNSHDCNNAVPSRLAPGHDAESKRAEVFWAWFVGFSPKGIEDDGEIQWRKDFLRQIGYKQ